MAIASAPAKIILFGEHFVIYNIPAILASINKRITVDSKLISSNKNTIRIEANDFGTKVYPISILKNINNITSTDFYYPIIYILKKLIKNFEKTEGLYIKI